jgi:uncharacterized protein
MKCPSCKEAVLSMSERNGIEIDFCPECRGVWLDRGELDKIISKAVAEQEAVTKSEMRSAATSPAQETHHPSNRPTDLWQGEQFRKNPYGYKRKKSFLEDLFD